MCHENNFIPSGSKILHTGCKKTLPLALACTTATPTWRATTSSEKLVAAARRLML